MASVSGSAFATSSAAAVGRGPAGTRTCFDHCGTQQAAQRVRLRRQWACRSHRHRVDDHDRREGLHVDVADHIGLVLDVDPVPTQLNAAERSMAGGAGAPSSGLLSMRADGREVPAASPFQSSRSWPRISPPGYAAE